MFQLSKTIWTFVNLFATFSSPSSLSCEAGVSLFTSDWRANMATYYWLPRFVRCLGCFFAGQSALWPSVSLSSQIMSRMQGLAALTASRCTGSSTSTNLLHPIPGWLALGVACDAVTFLIFWKKPFEWPLSKFINGFGQCLISENRVSMYLEDVIGSAHTWTFTEKEQILFAGPGTPERARAWLAKSWSAMHRRGPPQPRPVRGSVVQIWDVADNFGFFCRFLSVSILALTVSGASR